MRKNSIMGQRVGDIKVDEKSMKIDEKSMKIDEKLMKIVKLCTQ